MAPGNAESLSPGDRAAAAPASEREVHASGVATGDASRDSDSLHTLIPDSVPNVRASLQPIVQVVDMNPNKRGPVELQMLEMASQARARGWQLVVAFAAPAPAWYETAMTDAGGHLVCIPKPASDGRRAVGALVERLQPLVVHLHFVPGRRMQWLHRDHPSVAVVRTEHTWLPKSHVPRRLARHLGMRWIDRHIAVSRSIARQLQREYLIPAHKIDLVLNGVDLERFRPLPTKYELRQRLVSLAPDVVVVTVAANLIPRKRIDLIVRAMPTVLARTPQARLIIAGDGPERARLAALITALGLHSSVQLLVGDNDVAELYAASDIAVLASWGEGLPGAGLEALAAGLPLVATATAGLSEVPEHGVSGIVLHDQSPRGVADALVSLIADPPRRHAMALAARDRATRFFDLRQTAASTLDVYGTLVASRQIRQNSPA